MQVTIQKLGNSQGIRIPKAFLEALGMMENDIVELKRSGDNIVIKKVTKESLAMYNPKQDDILFDICKSFL